MSNKNKISRNKAKHMTKSEKLAFVTEHCISNVRTCLEQLEKLATSQVVMNIEFQALVQLLMDKGILNKEDIKNECNKIQNTKQDTDQTNLSGVSGGSSESNNNTEIYPGHNEKESDLPLFEG